MDLKSRLRNKLNTANDVNNSIKEHTINNTKLTLAERIKLKKQQQVNDNNIKVENKHNNNNLELEKPLTLKEKLLLKKKEKENEQKQNTSLDKQTKISLSENKPIQINTPEPYIKKDTEKQIFDWFNSLNKQLSVETDSNRNKKRKFNDFNDNFFNKKTKINTNSKQKIDDKLYGIIFPFTNMQKNAIKNFSKPSPDDIILIANKQAELNQQSLRNMSLDSSNSAITKAKTVSPVKNNTNNKAISFIKETYSKQPHLSLCILGHIDSGKSTLTGRLLLDTNAVSHQQITALQKQSKELGKQSFWLAWLMDSDSEERERGITKKFGYARFQSSMGLQYTLLDAPGHSDFISSTIVAIQQSSVCTIVVDCIIGGFEKSFDGQLKEHLLLASKFVTNLDDLIFVMNKMDVIDWDEERYLFIMNKIKNYMIVDLKIDEKIVSNLEFIPVSSIEGDNVVKPVDIKNNPKCSWYKGSSFIEKLDEKNLEHFKIDFPELTDKYINQDNSLAIVLDNQQQNKNNGAKQKGKDCSLTVKIINGYFTKNDKITISPRLTSKGYEIDDIWIETKEITNKNVPFAIKNQFVTLKIKNCNIDMVSVGDIISLAKEKDLVHCSHEFQLKVETFEMNRPLLPGSPIIIYMNDVEIPCMISSIKVFKEIVDGEQKTKKKLKHLNGNTSNATLNIEIQEINESIKSKELGFSQDDLTLEEKVEKFEEEDEESFKIVIPVFTAKENNQLSKLLIRKDGQTIAFGHINKRLD